MVYPCDFYVLGRYGLGNLNETGLDEIRNSSNAAKFLKEYAQPAKRCIVCKYNALCHGGCRRYRDPAFDMKDINRFCISYEMFFETALPRMENIAKAVKGNR